VKSSENDDMKINEIPTSELRRLLRATEQIPDPDEYAISVLRKELSRRAVDRTAPPGSRNPREAEHR